VSGPRRYGERAARLEGGFWKHRKTQALPFAARGLWASMLSYVADAMSDGFIPDVALFGFAGLAAQYGEDYDKMLAALVAGGWVERVDGGAQLVGYEDRNITRKQWERQKKETRERVQKSRRRSADVTRYNEVGNAVLSTSTSTSLSLNSEDPERASGAPPPPPSALDQAERLLAHARTYLRQGYARRYEDRTGDQWTGYHASKPYVDAVASWALSAAREVCGGYPDPSVVESALDAALDGFYRLKGPAPLKWLAEDAAYYAREDAA
jgi:hypothetical protein